MQKIQQHRHLAIILILLAIALSPALCFNLFNRIDLSIKSGAACLDGSVPAFYMWVPDDLDKPVNKVLIYFQQTPFGWCVRDDLQSSIQQCFRFITESNLNQHASTNTWSGSYMVLSGIMSPFDGGQFSQWTKISIKSCDGGAYMGNRDPIDFKKHKLHFKGSVNIQEIFKYLQAKKIIANRQQIVLAGSMNGAVAAMSWLQTFKQYTNSPVRLLIDSGLHLNEYNRKTNKTVFQDRMKMLQSLFLNNASPPAKQCSQAHKQQQWRCLFGLQLQKYIKQPIFYTQSLYDGWSLDQILGFKCAQQFASLSQCQQWERQIIKQYHKNITKQLKQVSQKQGNGAFGIACIAHQFVKGRWNNQMFQVPMNSGNIAMNATNQWLKTKKNIVHIDAVDWPENKECSRKLVYAYGTQLMKQ